MQEQLGLPPARGRQSSPVPSVPANANNPAAATGEASMFPPAQAVAQHVGELAYFAQRLSGQSKRRPHSPPSLFIQSDEIPPSSPMFFSLPTARSSSEFILYAFTCTRLASRQPKKTLLAVLTPEIHSRLHHLRFPPKLLFCQHNQTTFT